MAQLSRVRFLASVLFLLSFVFNPLFTFGQEKVEKPADTVLLGPFSGTAKDEDGNPVAGAKVWLVRRDFNDKAKEKSFLAETTTDAKGAFRFDAQPWPVGYGTHRVRKSPPCITVLDDQGRFGSNLLFNNNPALDLETDKPYDNMEIRLEKTKKYTGRIIDADGKPIESVVLRLSACLESSSTDDFIRRFYPPMGLEGETQIVTDKDGVFTVPHLPVKCNCYFDIEASDYPNSTLVVYDGKSTDVVLEKPGVLRGKLRLSKDAAVADLSAKIEIDCGKYDPAGRYRLDFGGTYFTEKDGSFKIDPFMPGKIWLQITPQNPMPFCDEDLRDVELKSGETKTLDIELKPGVQVQGRVVDEETGEGVPDTSLFFRGTDIEKGQRVYTDADGRFETTVPRGNYRFMVEIPPQKYIGVAGLSSMRTLDFQKDTTLETFALKRSKTLEGVVVDKKESPVAGAKVFYFNPNKELGGTVLSDSDGKFTLQNGIVDKQKLIVAAQTDRAASERVLLTIDTSKPLKLVADPSIASSVSGVVVDENQKPVANAKVSVIVHIAFGAILAGWPCNSMKTGADGKFELHALWPGETYSIEVTAKKHENISSKRLAVPAGKTLDFGSLALRRSDGVVSGKIVDAAGKPVADARVFNVADGPNPIETKSDVDGRFTLKGFCTGPVFVFAEKENYRFAGVSTRSGESNAVVRMYKKEETPPQRPLPDPVKTWEADKNRAAKLLEIAWPLVDEKKRVDLVKRMIRLEKEKAERWAGEAKIDLDPLWLYENDDEAFEKLAEKDLDEALSLLVKKPVADFDTLVRWAEHFIAADPEKARRCIEEALLQARNEEEPNRSWHLAMLGTLLTRSGDKEGGKKLTQEALQTIVKLAERKSDEKMLATLGKSLIALGPNDLPGALSLLKKIPNKYKRYVVKTMLIGNLDDYDKAREIMPTFEELPTYQPILFSIKKFAPSHPAEIHHLIEQYTDAYPTAKYYRALALCFAAQELASRDMPMACSWIDEAFESLLAKSEVDDLFRYGGRASLAAYMAVTAANLGYPDRESLLYRALACRPQIESDDKTNDHEAAAMSALYLAFLDPETARRSLEFLKPYGDTIGTGHKMIEQADWLLACRVADPDAALVDLTKKLAAAKTDKERQVVIEEEILPVVDFWLKSPQKRFQDIVHKNEDIFPPALD